MLRRNGLRAFLANNRIPERITLKALHSNAFQKKSTQTYIRAQKPQVRHVHIFNSTFPDNHSNPSPRLLLLLLSGFRSRLLLFFAIAPPHCSTTQLFPPALFRRCRRPSSTQPQRISPVLNTQTFLLLLLLSLLSLVLLSLLCFCSFTLSVVAFVFLLLSLHQGDNDNQKHGTTQ
ncbi:hypothetical protein [Stenotrophomonas pigmentata]|uniref:hypothetical protein n=1 Tax=Stenotrophomonas pigmentata TaxID=3055080 RepID=UPI0026EAF30B|nr:hypothetical protein [Stenotrophomonas sp. 610A2]